jgi:hypothetical protein
MEGRPLATSCDPDLDALIAELGAALSPPARNAFEVAARDVLQAACCSGVGAGYRLLRDVQRQHWDPPDDARAAGGPRHFRRDKPTDPPPLEEDTARGRASARSRWLRAV